MSDSKFSMPSWALGLRVASFLILFLLAGCGGDEEKESAESAVVQIAVKDKGEILEALEDLEESWKNTDNPTSDGWETEAFGVAAGAQFDQLGKWLTSDGDPAGLAGLFVDPAVVSIPDAESSTEVFDRGAVQVQRKASGAAEKCGLEELAKKLKSYYAKFSASDDARYKFKIYGIEQAGEGGEIGGVVAVSFVATKEGKVFEAHSHWVVKWEGELEDAAPRLSEVVFSEVEQAETRGTSATLFTDLTSSVLGGTDCYETQIMRGLTSWLKRSQGLYPMSRFGPSGVAVGDVNGDGLDDLYLCQESWMPNRLFLQQPDGSAREMSVEWGVDWIEDSRGVLLVDLDNDGDQDLVVATFQNLVIASNEGTRFEVRNVISASESLVSLTAADYDQDGDLDIYVGAYAPDELLQPETGQVAFPGEFLYTDANNGPANSLFRNDISDSGWEFIDVTSQVGLDENNRRWTLAASWEDYDNDGDQDLYVANDFGRNNLFRNDEGKFVDVAGDAKAEDSASGMSAAWGDYDRNGFVDLYVGNMWSSAGRRIVQQDGFKPGIGDELRSSFKRFARGNSLLRNTDGKLFEDVSETAGVTMGRWAWSSPFVDVNNDGWEDIVVANGYITGEDPGDL